ncbi:MAG: acyltransferase, partial [Kangiellaceae bacterium]|nr:acyltransferase [Kangiellaceae bacterium]
MKITSSTLSLNYIPELDGLRGVAILGVLAFHMGILEGGFLGVDLFFVLSGYLITSLLIHEKKSHGQNFLPAFWLRRARRLLPALMLFLVVTGGIIQWNNDSANFMRVRNDILATLFYVANWRSIFAETDYWSLFSSPSPLSHTWSLAIEEQFYLLWPFVVAWSFSFSKAPFILLRNIAIIGVVLSVSWFSYLYSQNNENLSRVYFGTDTRIFSILGGSALSVHQAYSKRFTTKIGIVSNGITWMIWISVSYLFMAWLFLSGTNPLLYQGGLFLSSLAVIIILVSITQNKSPLLSNILLFSPLRMIGQISYGLYLWHYPLFIFVEQNYSTLTPSLSNALKLAITFSIAIVSYLFLEAPIRKQKSSRRTNQLLLIFATTCIVGEIYFLSSRAINLPLQADFASVKVTQEESNKVVRTLVVGDSIAVNMALGLSDSSAVKENSLRFSGTVACGILGNIEVKRHDGNSVLISTCSQVNANWKNSIIWFNPDIVILMYGGPMTDRLIDGVWSHPCERNFDDVYRDQLSSTIDLLSSTGANIVIPTIAYSLVKEDTNYSLHQRLDCINDIFRTLSEADERVSVLELARFVCPSHFCRKEIDGVILRNDG